MTFQSSPKSLEDQSTEFQDIIDETGEVEKYMSPPARVEVE